MTAFMHAQGPESIKDDCKGLFFPLCEGGGGTWLFKPGFHWSEAHGGISPNNEAQPVTCPKCLKMMANKPAVHAPGPAVNSEPEPAESTDADIMVTILGIALIELAHLPRRFVNAPGRKWLEPAQVITPWGTGMKERAAGNPSDTVSATRVLRRPSCLGWARDHDAKAKPPMEDFTDLLCD